MKEKAKRRMLFIGILDVSWSSNIPMKKAFEKNGYIIDPFNYRTIAKKFTPYYRLGRRVYYYAEQFANCLKLPFCPKFVKKIGYSINGRRRMNEILLETVKRGNYDIVFFAKADIVDYSLIPEINRYANTWYFFMDPPDIAFKINASQYANKATWSSTSSPSIYNNFKKVGANCFFISEGVDTEIFYPKETKKIFNVTFVGNNTWKRKRFIKILAKQGIEVNLFGKGFPRGPIYSHDLAQVYRESKIILNIDRPGAKFSARVFQAMGTGSMMLSEYSYNLSLIFKQKVHLDWFHDADEAIHLIKYYLKKEKEREEITRKGTQYVLSNYSWEKRIEKILEIINQSSKNKSRKARILD